VAASEEMLDPTNTSSVLNSNFHTINNQYEHQGLSGIMRLLNAHQFWKSMDSADSDYKGLFPDLPETKFPAHQVLPILFI
jgi:hypothetical protein